MCVDGGRSIRSRLAGLGARGGECARQTSGRMGDRLDSGLDVPELDDRSARSDCGWHADIEAASVRGLSQTQRLAFFPSAR